MTFVSVVEGEVRRRVRSEQVPHCVPLLIVSVLSELRVRLQCCFHLSCHLSAHDW